MSPVVANNRRCEYIVIDTSTRRNRKCKKSFSFLINGCKCCYQHANKNYGNIIAKIQAVVRGNICRSKINRLKEMPSDIQKIISGYMREDFENSRYNCQLSNFLVKKIYKTIVAMTGSGYYFCERAIYHALRNYYNVLEIFNLIKLIHKYKLILNYNKKYIRTWPLSIVDNFGFINISLKCAVQKIIAIISRNFQTVDVDGTLVVVYIYGI